MLFQQLIYIVCLSAIYCNLSSHLFSKKNFSLKSVLFPTAATPATSGFLSTPEPTLDKESNRCHNNDKGDCCLDLGAHL